MKSVIVIAFAGVSAVLTTASKGAVVDIRCHFHGYGNYSTYNWSFDYDLQQLTITETISEIELPYNALNLWGALDSGSTFSVIRTITNDTGVSWTGYILESRGTIMPGGSVGYVPETVESTMLQTITYRERSIIEFAEPPPVLDGESLTIQFDLYTSGTVEFNAVFKQEFVPEPATFSFLALGTLGLARRRNWRERTPLSN